MMYDLDRTGMKKIDKNGKKCMHWNLVPDAIPVLARLVHILDRWRVRNDRMYVACMVVFMGFRSMISIYISVQMCVVSLTMS